MFSPISAWQKSLADKCWRSSKTIQRVVAIRFSSSSLKGDNVTPLKVVGQKACRSLKQTHCSPVFCQLCVPNQQHTLNKLPAELRCRNCINKHQLSMQVGAKRAKNCACNVYLFQLGFRFTYHSWWLSWTLVGFWEFSSAKSNETYSVLCSGCKHVVDTQAKFLGGRGGEGGKQ